MENIEKMTDFGPIEMAQQVNIDADLATAANRNFAINIFFIGLGILGIGGVCYIILKNKNSLVVKSNRNEETCS